MLDLLDAAIVEVTGHRRSGPDPAGDGPDPMVFDQQTLADLLAFLQDARGGRLSPEEVAYEAALWQQLVDVGWPAVGPGSPVEQAVALLADVPADDDPANPLEDAMAAVTRDEAARPALWQALYEGQLVLPLVRPGGADLQFLSAPTDDARLVLGFATEARFDTLLPDGAEMSRVLAPGPDLPKIWPAGHWLMINPGHATKVVLSPGEVTGLPHGERRELPHPRSVEVAPPEDDDGRALLLSAATVAVGGCRLVHWARLRRRDAPEHAPWRDALVVTAADGADQDAVVRALRSVLPPAVFPSPVVVGRRADLVHPLVDAVVADGRPVHGR